MKQFLVTACEGCGRNHERPVEGFDYVGTYRPEGWLSVIVARSDYTEGARRPTTSTAIVDAYVCSFACAAKVVVQAAMDAGEDPNADPALSKEEEGTPKELGFGETSAHVVLDHWRG